MYFNENWSAEICPLNRGNPLNRGPLNRGFTVYLLAESNKTNMLKLGVGLFRKLVLSSRPRALFGAQDLILRQVAWFKA